MRFGLLLGRRWSHFVILPFRLGAASALQVLATGPAARVVRHLAFDLTRSDCLAFGRRRRMLPCYCCPRRSVVPCGPTIRSSRRCFVPAPGMAEKACHAWHLHYAARLNSGVMPGRSNALSWAVATAGSSPSATVPHSTAGFGPHHARRSQSAAFPFGRAPLAPGGCSVCAVRRRLSGIGASVLRRYRLRAVFRPRRSLSWLRKAVARLPIDCARCGLPLRWTTLVHNSSFKPRPLRGPA